jgi:hypothetical protein
VLEIREHPPSMLRNVDCGPLGGSVEDPIASTINTKKHRRWTHWEAMMEIREHPPSTLRNVDGGPLGGGAEDSGVPTINTKKC